MLRSPLRQLSRLLAAPRYQVNTQLLKEYQRSVQKVNKSGLKLYEMKYEQQI